MPDDPARTRILTLVFTDLVDSTALKTRHGDEFAGTLIARHRALVRQLAADGGGRIVDWAGDGCFLTFETASAAVYFALRLQQAHGDDAELPAVRVGLHLGEVGEIPGGEGEARVQVAGLAVDVAARIAALAGPSQVLLSAAAADSARPRIDHSGLRRPIVWQACGSYVLKGVAEPVEIRAVGLDGLSSMKPPAGSGKGRSAQARGLASTTLRTTVTAVLVAALLAGLGLAFHMAKPPSITEAPPAAASLVAARDATPLVPMNDIESRPAIAVLPFDNLSPDPEQAFFADGLAEDLITRLSAWRAFPVIARNSSFQYRGGNRDLKAVGRELGARYLVEGSVRRGGERIRVTAQLIDTRSGEHLWAKSYDRALSDMFTVQDEISSTIAASIAGDVTRAEAERARQRGTADLDAWGAYQLGLQSHDRYTREAFAEARAHFARALELDPDFAAALAHQANTETFAVYFGWQELTAKWLAAAIEVARQAIAVDPREPMAHAALASLLALGGDVPSGLAAGRRAIELNPSSPEAWLAFSWLNILNGDSTAALAASERARALDPHGAHAWFADDNIAGGQWELGNYAESMVAARRIVAARPNYYWGHLYVALNEVALGRLDAARAAVAEARRVYPSLTLAVVQRLYSVARPEVDARRDAALRQAGLE
ncbi:MAG: adenylate/guanylate cyclase domain-containing protein [Gammaproteobacteria bacterium]